MQFYDEQSGAISPNREKSGMSKRNLAGITHQNIQAHGEDDMDHHEVKQIKVIFGKVKGQGKKKDKESSRPEENHLAFKQLNVLIVITFHIHGNLSLTGLALR
jgi:hypothetical protein